jgi:methylmalonyl-CoA/ethylmalonyl-CoA epimerase
MRTNTTLRPVPASVKLNQEQCVTMENLLASTHAVLASTPPRWSQLAHTVPAELLARPAAPSQWSAYNCLQHLIDTERFVFPARVRAFLAGRDFNAFDPDRQGTVAQTGRSALELSAEFAILRADSLRLFDTLAPGDLERQAIHQELGPVTLSQLVHEWAGHDLMHTVQAERALMQPFIDGCGPWQSYFADHVAHQQPNPTPPAAGAALAGQPLTQVGLVVANIEQAARDWADLLGVPVPNIITTDTVELAHTEHHGQPTPARARLAFFKLGQVDLGLIEPLGAPSTWNDQLSAHGPSLHHIAFEVKRLPEVVAQLAAAGLPLAQRGDYTGGRYAYVDGGQRLGAVIELLEND